MVSYPSMIKLFLKIAVNTLVLYVAAQYIAGFTLSDTVHLLALAAVLTLVNSIV